MKLPLFRWGAPDAYTVAFTTRVGGVSEGPYESLNLGRLTGDEPERVDENRRRLCAKVGADLERFTLNRQEHSAVVHRAHAGRRGEPGDGLWTDERGVPMVALGADCLLIAIARAESKAPALAVLHAGWRGLLEGVVASAAAALDGGRKAAVIGPAIGPCCYEVGDEVAEPFRQAFGPDVVVGGRRLDLWTSAERALEDAGCATVERLDLCTACNPDLFFSERRTGKPRGTHGVIGFVDR
jgi:polyphenol oxidase